MARRRKPAPPRLRTVTQVKKGAFLDAYRKIGTVSAAARVAGVTRRTHQLWMKKDPAYVEAHAEAHEDFIELLEQEARRRGVVGWDEPVVYQGQFQYENDPITHQRRQVVVRKHSDMLLQAQLNGMRPERYRYRLEHTGPGGGPIPHRHAGTIVVVDGPKEKYIPGLRAAREAALAAAGGDGHGGDGAGKTSGDGHG